MSAISAAMAWVDAATTDAGVLAFLAFAVVIMAVGGRPRQA